MTWTPDRITQLKKLAADGLSASQIARELGGVSRSAVIAKLRRFAEVGDENARLARRRPDGSKTRRIVELAREGKSSREIAAQVGSTRRAVDDAVSKARKRGVDIPPRTTHPNRTMSVKTKQPRIRKNAKSPNMKTREPIPVARTDVPEPESLGLSLLELRDATETASGTCKWPSGDGPFTFCGHDTFAGGVYCEHHASRAYQPIPRRVRPPFLARAA